MIFIKEYNKVITEKSWQKVASVLFILWLLDFKIYMSPIRGLILLGSSKSLSDQNWSCCFSHFMKLSKFSLQLLYISVSSVQNFKVLPVYGPVWYSRYLCLPENFALTCHYLCSLYSDFHLELYWRTTTVIYYLVV